MDVFVSSASTLSQVFSMLYWLDLELGKPNHVETSVKWDVKREQGKSGNALIYCESPHHGVIWQSPGLGYYVRGGERVQGR